MNMKTSRFLLLLIAVLSLGCLAQSQATPGMPPEKVAVILGQHIHYYEAGQGPVVLLLHGLGGSAGNWAATIGPLAAKYHVYALDQIGFGHSDKPFIEYKVATFVDFLQAFIQQQNIAKATLVGNSLGGWISLQFTLEYPDMVDKLVLVDAAGIRPTAGSPAPDLNIASLADERRIFDLIFYNKQIGTDAFVRQAFTRHLQDDDGYTTQRLLANVFQNQFVDDKLGSVHTPTLVVWGHDDALIPLANGEKMHQGIAGSKLLVLQQCGHVPQIEKPVEFNQSLLQFLAQ